MFPTNEMLNTSEFNPLKRTILSLQSNLAVVCEKYFTKSNNITKKGYVNRLGFSIFKWIKEKFKFKMILIQPYFINYT